jgi:methionine aminotransferase
VFKPLKTEGSYFQCVQFPASKSISDRLFSENLIVKHRVASIPLSAFYSGGRDERILRFCFAKKDETLEAAIQQLRQVGELL